MKEGKHENAENCETPFKLLSVFFFFSKNLDISIIFEGSPVFLK